MTDHPGEQFPSEVDPDVEPGYEPDPDESPEPDYDSEPGAQSSYALKPSQQGVPHSDPLLAGFTMYGGLPPEEEPVAEVAPRPVVPSPASFQPRPPVPAPPVAARPVPAPVAERPQYEERDSGTPHPLVEETMARLDELRERPVGDHAEVYADLHERLQTALVEADTEDRA